MQSYALPAVLFMVCYSSIKTRGEKTGLTNTEVQPVSWGLGRRWPTPTPWTCLHSLWSTVVSDAVLAPTCSGGQPQALSLAVPEHFLSFLLSPTQILPCGMAAFFGHFLSLVTSCACRPARQPKVFPPAGGHCRGLLQLTTVFSCG